MKISIVTTMYYSAPYIKEFYERISESAKKITTDYEIIFVNDGSPDESLEIAVDIYNKDAKVKVIDLSRNFGHHKAIMTGLSYARGEKVFLLDCDLEEKPELLNDFWEELDRSNNVDVVYGVHEKRKGSLSNRITGAAFYTLFNFLSHHKIPPNIVNTRLMTRRYVASLLRHQESEIVIAGLFSITGFKQTPICVKTNHKGKSSYTFRKKLTQAVDAITSFSSKPLLFIFYCGFGISFFSGCYIIQLIVKKIFYDINTAGYTSIIVSIWFLGGITIFSIGLVGIYMSKVFIEVKKRPYTIIREVYDKHKKND